MIFNLKPCIFYELSKIWPIPFIKKRRKILDFWICTFQINKGLFFIWKKRTQFFSFWQNLLDPPCCGHVWRIKVLRYENLDLVWRDWVWIDEEYQEQKRWWYPHIELGLQGWPSTKMPSTTPTFLEIKEAFCYFKDLIFTRT